MIGTILSNRYKILGELGTGGMSWVYLAEDLREDQKVAVKILYPQLSQDTGFVQRFTQEAKLVMSLSQSMSMTHIVRVLDYGSHHDTRYLVMEYVVGRDLRRVLNEEGFLSWKRALDVAQQIAQALEHAYLHGIVHRDVKPANVMILDDGTVRMLDFGIARARTSPTLTYSGFVGSPHYVAPEQAMGRRVDIRADLYSLGVVMYEMLTGDRPFQSETPWAIINHHIATPPPPLEQVRPDLPISVARLLRKAMAKRPEDRFQTPSEMGSTILAVLSGQDLLSDSWVATPDAQAALLDSLYRQAQEAAALEDWRQAVDLFSQILRLDPRHRDVTEQLAEAGRQARLAALYDAAQLSIKAGYWDDALALLDEIARSMPVYRDVQALKARTLKAQVKQEEEIAQPDPQEDPLPEASEWLAAMKDFDQHQEQFSKQEQVVSPKEQAVPAQEQLAPAKGQPNPAPVPAGPKPARRSRATPALVQILSRSPLRRRKLVWAVAAVLLLAIFAESVILYRAQEMPAIAAVSSTSTMPPTGDPADAAAKHPSIDGARRPPTEAALRDLPTETLPPPTATHTQAHKSAPALTVPEIGTPSTAISATDPPPTDETRPSAAALSPTSTETATLTPTSTFTPTIQARAVVPRPKGQIAFPRFDPARGTYDVYVCHVDGSNCRRVVSEASQPDFLPGGSRLVVHSWKGDDKGLVLHALSGERVWKISGQIEAARPSADFLGTSYAYHSREGADRLPYLYRTEETERWPVLREANPVQGHSPAWLPDGRILYSGCLGDDCGIIVLGADGSNPRQIVAGGSETNPEASPDGQKVAFMSQRDGNWEIYVASLDGGKGGLSSLQRLTDNPASDGLPTWSPDGQYLAFVSDRDGRWAVWVMRADGRQQRKLFDLGGPLEGPVRDAAPHEIQGWVEERISWGPLP